METAFAASIKMRKQDQMSLIETNHHNAPARSVLPHASSPIAPKSNNLPLPTRIAFVGNYLPRQCGIAT
ncbi:MAG: hypothetical protein ABSG51_18240, partial [Terracidiphilus sp.]